MKTNNIMTFKRFLKYFNIKESFKEKRLNSILMKINNKEQLTKVEKEFLDRYNDINDEDIKDHMMITMSTAYNVISNILQKGTKIICNLTDRDGRINSEIKSIERDYENELCILTLKNGENFKMRDNFLYNIIYNIDNNDFSLEIHDEYFEKIPVKR